MNKFPTSNIHIDGNALIDLRRLSSVFTSTTLKPEISSTTTTTTTTTLTITARTLKDKKSKKVKVKTTMRTTTRSPVQLSLQSYDFNDFFRIKPEKLGFQKINFSSIIKKLKNQNTDGENSNNISWLLSYEESIHYRKSSTCKT